MAVKEADELLAKAEVSDMKECGEGILLVLSNGILVCIDEEKQISSGPIRTLPKIAGK